MFKKTLQTFFADTSGAVTLPWVAAGGMVVIVGASAMGLSGQGYEALQEDNNTFFENIDNTGGSNSYN